MSQTQELEQSPGFDAIAEVCELARASANQYIFFSIICGQMLLEEHASICSSHVKTATNLRANQHTPEDDRFCKLLAEKCPAISRATAYRRMKVANKIVQELRQLKVLDLPFIYFGHQPVHTHVEWNGSRRLISRVLIDQECKTKENVSVGHVVIQYLEDKTITGILHSIDGKEHGGSNENDNRRDFPKFVGRAMDTITGLLMIRRKRKLEVIRRGHLVKGKEPVIHERALTKEQKDAINSKVDPAVGSWPEWFTQKMYLACSRKLKIGVNRSLVDKPAQFPSPEAFTHDECEI